VTVPYVVIFLALLAAYLLTSEWAGLDSRSPIVIAMVLLIAIGIVDAAGDTATADTMAEYVIFLLGGGIILLTVDLIRDAWGYTLAATTTDASGRNGGH
jgi:hypothetical protein